MFLFLLQKVRIIKTLRDTGSNADTTEAIERALAIGVRYATRPTELAAAIANNTVLTQTGDTVVSMTVAIGAVLSLLVQGHPFDTNLSQISALAYKTLCSTYSAIPAYRNVWHNCLPGATLKPIETPYLSHPIYKELLFVIT